MNGDTKRISASELRRKTNKPIMEKKRRERINSCLEELKTMVLRSINEESRPSKLEKADILEMTVRYLRSIQPILQMDRSRDLCANKSMDSIACQQNTRNGIGIMRSRRSTSARNRNSPYPVQAQATQKIFNQTLPDNRTLESSMLLSDLTSIQPPNFSNGVLQRVQLNCYNVAQQHHVRGYSTPPVSPPTVQNHLHSCPFPVSPISSVGSEGGKSPNYSTSDSSDSSATFKTSDSWSEHLESKTFRKELCSKEHNIWRPWGMMAL